MTILELLYWGKHSETGERTSGNRSFAVAVAPSRKVAVKLATENLNH